MQISVDLWEPKPTDEEIAAAGEKGADLVNAKWDSVLSDVKIFGQWRSNVWKVDKPNSFSFLRLMSD